MEEDVLCRHREETKELRARLLAVRKAAKGDKKEKKRALAEIEKLENEMKERHERELEQLKENEKPVPQPPKQSRAQRRKERKLGEAKEREDRVLAEEEEDRKTSQRHLEREKLKELLSKENMSIHDIAPDGDCLYSAISHQLSHEKMTYSAKELRSLAADEILANPDTYVPFLIDHDESGHGPQDIREYCTQIKETSNWGGQVEIQALCARLNCAVRVYQAEENQPLLFGSGSKTLHLVYHRHEYGLGEHYNSVTLQNK